MFIVCAPSGIVSVNIFGLSTLFIMMLEKVMLRVVL